MTRRSGLGTLVWVLFALFGLGILVNTALTLVEDVRVSNEKAARIAQNTALTRQNCARVNELAAAVKALAEQSTSTAAMFPADVVARIQDPAVRDLLTAVAMSSELNRQERAPLVEAIRIVHCPD